MSQSTKLPHRAHFPRRYFTRRPLDSCVFLTGILSLGLAASGEFLFPNPNPSVTPSYLDSHFLNTSLVVPPRLQAPVDTNCTLHQRKSSPPAFSLWEIFFFPRLLPSLPTIHPHLFPPWNRLQPTQAYQCLLTAKKRMWSWNRRLAG